LATAATREPLPAHSLYFIQEAAIGTIANAALFKAFAAKSTQIEAEHTYSLWFNDKLFKAGILFLNAAKTRTGTRESRGPDRGS